MLLFVKTHLSGSALQRLKQHRLNTAQVVKLLISQLGEPCAAEQKEAQRWCENPELQVGRQLDTAHLNQLQKSPFSLAFRAGRGSFQNHDPYLEPYCFANKLDKITQSRGTILATRAHFLQGYLSLKNKKDVSRQFHWGSEQKWKHMGK